MAVFIGIGLGLGACSSKADEEPEDSYETLKASGKVTVSATATPEVVAAGEKVNFTIAISATRKTTVNVGVEVHSPDGSVVHSTNFEERRIESTSSPMEITDTFSTGSNAPAGVYVLNITVLHTRTSKILVEKESVAKFTITSSGKCENASTIPASHTLDYHGVMHMPGESNPFGNCSKCHGFDLKSGRAQSCFDCHNANEHAEQYGGVKHQSGSAFACNTCHGPNNSGGMGQACSDCHH